MPLLPILVAQPDAALLQRERELILQEPDRQKRADLLACVVTIGARHFSSEFLWRFFEEMVKLMEESVFLDKLFEKKLEKEVQEHELSAKQMILHHIVYHRFGAIPADLEMSLESLPAKLSDIQLQSLVDAALDVPDVQSLRKEVDKFKLLVTEIPPTPAAVSIQ